MSTHLVNRSLLGRFSYFHRQPQPEEAIRFVCFSRFHHQEHLQSQFLLPSELKITHETAIS
ncbi:hypothetical protein HanPSC8_Chr02g0064031 [Helianthus annuus]|nr:hypothetical protein HanPSC8_Chr02g0064031 [Helianthus annuus]